MLTKLAYAAATALVLIASAAPAEARVGALTQLPGKAGCVAQQNSSASVRRQCAVARFAGNQLWDLAVSPDGRNLYVASIGGAVSVLRIHHGGLTQLPRKTGCFSRTGSFGCTRWPALNKANEVVVGPDGRAVYVGANGGVVIFGRNQKTGALRKIGCVGEDGRNGCTSLRTPLGGITGLAVTHDGHNVYAASGGVVVALRRGHRGGLSQMIGNAGCMNADGSSFCTRARGLLPGCCGIAISPRSDNVYLSSSHFPTPDSAHFALAAFARDTRGILMQLPGAAGCVNQDGGDGCTAVAFNGDEPENTAGDIVISPNGRNLYVAHSSTFPTAEAAICGASENFIAMFPRDPNAGTLGPLGQDIGACGSIPALSSDGRSMYGVTGNFGNELSIFSRNRSTGLLSAAGCIDPNDSRCQKARHLPAPSSAAITPNGRYVFVISDDPAFGETIGVFKRSLR